MQKGELQQLVGHLSFASRVVVPSKSFLRRFCDAIVGVWSLYHRLCISTGMRVSLEILKEFLKEVPKGVQQLSFQREDMYIKAELQVMMNAVSSLRFGGCFRGCW